MAPNNENIADNIGFGSRLSSRVRLVNDDGSFNIKRIGGDGMRPFEHLVHLPWPLFAIEFLGIFLVINAGFALGYYLLGIEHLSGVPVNAWQDYLHCFYFSIQTFTTVGYGFLNPQDNATNLISSLNAITGLTFYALATGLLIFRVSKAHVKIRFSDNIIIAPHGDKKSLQLRLVNAGSNTLVNMEASVNMTWLEETEGVPRRKFQRLNLELDFIYLFPLNWTLIHVIDENSPLYQKSLEDLRNQTSELLVMVRGYDDTYDQFIYKNHSYFIDSVRENEVFLPMYESLHDKTLLHIRKLNDTKKITD